jgi:WD40 repeat protein
MGSGISQQDVTKHLETQNQLISQLQAIVDWQGQAIHRLMTYNECDPSMEKVARDSGESSIADEVSHRAKPRKEDKPITAEELAAPNAQWSEPNAEEERNFMATKPWLGAMAMPDGFTYGKTDGLPDVQLELEHVHGYRTRGCRNNIAWVDCNTIVYFAAGVGIVHDLSSNKQTFFRNHTDDILCLAYHSGKGLVATGEIGAKPKICVWNVKDGREVATFAPIHKRGVVSVAFSADGNKLASVGLDDDHTVAVHDVTNGQLLGAAKGDTNRILDIQCNMTRDVDSNNEFVTVGVKHIKFWNIAGTTLTPTRGLLGSKGEQKSLLTVAFTTQFTCVGTSDGEIYVFKKNQLYKPLDAHQKHLFALKAVGDDLYSGGRDGYLSKWNMNSFLKVGSVNMNKAEDPEVLKSSANSVRAIDILDDNNILVGTVTSSIYSVDFTAANITNLISAHYGDLEAKEDDADGYGELWGLDCHPKEAVYATTCEDKSLRLWDVKTRKPLTKIMIKDNAICLAWAPDGKQIAVGGKSGGVQILNYANKQFEDELTIKKRAKRIQCMAFSPNGKFLAVGSAENLIDIYSVDNGNYKLSGTCKGNSSVILHVDFSKDSKFIQSCAQSYELLFYESENANQFTKSRDLRNTEWNTFTSILGWDVQGIWPAESDGSDINAVARSRSAKYLASAEDSGAVRLFNYPCVGGGLDKTGKLTRRPQSQVGRGHSSHVTNVDWLFDDSYLLSVGGADMSVFQWKVVKA